MNASPTPAEYAEMAEPRHGFMNVTYRGESWDLTHLNSFVLSIEIAPAMTIDVMVYFSCHCFTQSIEEHERQRSQRGEYYRDGLENRLLDPRRYELSRRFLPEIVLKLATRHIQALGGARPNYFTIEVFDEHGKTVPYTLFFEVVPSKTRKNRVVLFVQSAYVKEFWNRWDRQNAKKVRLATLVRRAYADRNL
jgi:hypothetical protein